MSENTGIAWTDHTFNPWSGCVKVSAGCANCYASNLPPSMRRNAVWGEDAERIPASDAYWLSPLTWARAAGKAKIRRRVFCASVADVFEARDDLNPWRDRLMALIALTPELDWQLLTKRPDNAAAYLSAPGLYQRILSAAPFFRSTPGLGDGVRWANDRMGVAISDPADLAAWWPHLWIGTSVEDQRAANERIPHLLRIPARVRFLSCEPLLGKVDLRLWLNDESEDVADDSFHRANADDVQAARGIQWVIVGGESGRYARDMRIGWAAGILNDCKAAGVPAFMKQMGTVWAEAYAANHKKGGDPDEWAPVFRVQEFPNV